MVGAPLCHPPLFTLRLGAVAAQRVQLAHNIARQAVEAKFRTALNQLEERLQATEGGDASTRAVRTAFREVEEETTSAFSRSAAVFTSLRKSMSDMRLMARKDFTSIVRRTTALFAVPHAPGPDRGPPFCLVRLCDSAWHGTTSRS